MVKRVTDNLLHEQSLHAVNTARARQMKNQEQSINMKRVNTPSDDPVAASQILKLKTDDRNIEQFKQNASLTLSVLNFTDNALAGATDVLMRAQELAISQSSDASATPESRKAIALEVEQMVKQMVNIGNTRFGERFIFGGFVTDSAPYHFDGSYHGDMGTIPMEVRDQYYIGMNIPGHVAFTALRREDEEGPKQINAFEVLQRLKFGLNTNDTRLIQSTLEDFSAVQSQVVAARASVGSRVKSIENTVATMDVDQIEKTKYRSELEDADILSTYSELNKDESVLKRTMQVSTKLIQPALFDYLD